MATSVGFIGVGNMGNPMALNVLKAGFPMTVYDRNPQAMENLLQAGARHAASAREVVEASEIVFTSLPASPDVESVYLEPGGIGSQCQAGNDSDRPEQRAPLDATEDRATRPGARCAFPGSAGQRRGQRCTSCHIGDYGGGRP